MEQRSNINDAIAMDAQKQFRKEEYALGMGQRSNDAAARDVQMVL